MRYKNLLYTTNKKTIKLIVDFETHADEFLEGFYLSIIKDGVSIDSEGNRLFAEPKIYNYELEIGHEYVINMSQELSLSGPYLLWQFVYYPTIEDPNMEISQVTTGGTSMSYDFTIHPDLSLTYVPPGIIMELAPLLKPIIKIQFGGYHYNCCIPYYSLVHYPNNTYKEAKDVNINDLILGYNIHTKEMKEVTVLNITKVTKNKYLEIYLENNIKLEITEDHPVYTNCGWCCYNPEISHYKNYKDIENLLKLNNSMKILTINGYKQITKIKEIILETSIDMYTFDTTDGVDTYITQNCIVHNGFC